jgi:hypothetical protein
VFSIFGLLEQVHGKRNSGCWGEIRESSAKTAYMLFWRFAKARMPSSTASSTPHRWCWEAVVKNDAHFFVQRDNSQSTRKICRRVVGIVILPNEWLTTIRAFLTAQAGHER